MELGSLTRDDNIKGVLTDILDIILLTQCTKSLKLWIVNARTIIITASEALSSDS